jgi:CheY-like chemotaxis protein
MENSEKKKVLVVDDDKHLMTLLVDKLNASGFEAVGVKNGEEGLETALKNHPDIILLDVVMPYMDGWQMLEKLREDEWGKTAKVIMLSVLENADNAAQAVEKGALGYLIKTNWSLDQVVEQIKEALKIQ